MPGPVRSRFSCIASAGTEAAGRNGSTPAAAVSRSGMGRARLRRFRRLSALLRRFRRQRLAILDHFGARKAQLAGLSMGCPGLLRPVPRSGVRSSRSATRGRILQSRLRRKNARTSCGSGRNRCRRATCRWCLSLKFCLFVKIILGRQKLRSSGSAGVPRASREARTGRHAGETPTLPRTCRKRSPPSADG